jgi:hypothetical protein
MPRVVPTEDKRAPAHIGAFVSGEQRQRLIARAREEDRSMSAILRRAIDSYLATPSEPGAMTLGQFSVEAAELQNLAGRRAVAPAPSAQAPAGAEQ